MKTKMKISMLLLIVITSLLVFSCNTENEGIFMRISNSQVKVDVGYVDIIGKNATDLFAYTSEKGFQKFNTASGDWTAIDTTVSYPGLYSTDSATATTEIYYAARSVAGETNNLYSYTIGGSESFLNSTYEIVEMKQDNLMLVKNGTGFDVYNDVNAGGLVSSFASKYSPSHPPRLIAQSNTEYVISGVKLDTTVEYEHYYLSSTNRLTPAPSDTSFSDSSVVALLKAGTNLLFVNSVGEIWSGTTAYNDFVLKETIPGFPTDRTPADLEYPTFIYNNELYLQNENNDFYKISSNGTISSELDSNFTDFLSGIRIKSYLEDGSTIYAGTMENGIVKITMTAPGVGNAVIL